MIRIHIPKLAHRSEDIPMLAQHFLARAGKELGVSPKILRPETQEYMQQLALARKRTSAREHLPLVNGHDSQDVKFILKTYHQS